MTNWIGFYKSGLWFICIIFLPSNNWF